MTGKETVAYLKANFKEGQDYAGIVIVKSTQTVGIMHPSEKMQRDLQRLGFEVSSSKASKSWKVEATLEPAPKVSDLFINKYSGLISLNLKVIGTGEFDESTLEYSIPDDFQIPDWS